MAQYVTVSIDGSVPTSFAGSEEPAAYGEIMSLGGLGPGVNGKLSAALADILEAKLSISASRFYVKFDDVQVRTHIDPPPHPTLELYSHRHTIFLFIGSKSVL